jgi:aldose 1-epimerase
MTEVTKQPYGTLEDGSEVSLWTLRNDRLSAQIAGYGARVITLETPDRSGAKANINLCMASFEPYLGRNFYLGATCGRVANRIAKGVFTLDGREYHIPLHNGPNALHGGPRGFDRYNWASRAIEDGVEFTMTSPDGDQGFPGTLDVTLRYTLEADALRMETRATTDAPTVINMTNHSYFNLAGEGTPSVLDHEVVLEADAFTPVDETAIPTGEIRSVEGTTFDFREPHAVGERIDWTEAEGAAEEDVAQRKIVGGYDHNFVVRGKAGALRPVASVYEPAGGRTLAVESTEPGVQFYSGNFLNGSATGPSGQPYVRRSGLCLETQGFPDAVNHANFPSMVLRPGEVYASTTLWRFGTRG